MTNNFKNDFNFLTVGTETDCLRSRSAQAQHNQHNLHPSPHPLVDIENNEWCCLFEILDPFIATRAELEALWQSAPNARVQDWLTGMMDMRKMYAAVSGRPF